MSLYLHDRDEPVEPEAVVEATGFGLKVVLGYLDDLVGVEVAEERHDSGLYEWHGVC